MTWARRVGYLGAVLFSATVGGCTALLDVSSYRTEDPDGGGIACRKNDDCVRQRGADWICRSSSKRCVNLKSDDCQLVVGDSKSDDAIVFGSLFPVRGKDETSGKPIENGVVLAVEDFATAGSIPAAPGKRRPLVLVACNDGAEEATAVRAARHLTDDVGVPAIVGAAYSGITIQVATQVTIPKGVLLISPSSTSIALTQLADNGLVWRTCPSDKIQADAHLALMPLIERDLKSKLPPDTKLRVAILNKGDAYGKSLAEEFAPRLVFNGESALSASNRKDFFRRHDYGDPQDVTRPPDYAALVQQVVSFAPHVVYLFGTTETIQPIIANIEAKWPRAMAYRPFYLMTDGGAVPEMSKYLSESDPSDETRKRILGTKPVTTGTNFQLFTDSYRARFHDGTSPEATWAVNAYDAVYNLGFAIASRGEAPISGPDLALGFARQVSGTRISPGSSNINTAFALLLAGQSFDYDGASGPLDFDLRTGEAVSDITLWCVQTHNGEPTDPRSSPVYYNTNHGLVGTLDDIRSFCGF